MLSAEGFGGKIAGEFDFSVVSTGPSICVVCSTLKKTLLLVGSWRLRFHLASVGRKEDPGQLKALIPLYDRTDVYEAEAQAKNKRRDPDAPSVLPAGEKKR